MQRQCTLTYHKLHALLAAAMKFQLTMANISVPLAECVSLRRKEYLFAAPLNFELSQTLCAACNFYIKKGAFAVAKAKGYDYEAFIFYSGRTCPF